MPKIYLAFAAIGVVSFMGAILMVVANSTAQTDHKLTGSNTNGADSHQVLGAQSITGDSPETGQNGSQGEASTGNVAATQQSGPVKVNGLANNSAQSGASVASGARKPAVPSSPTTSTPSRTGYNLNETWYLATAGAEGLFNSCWPAELNASNEAGCIDESNPYSRYWFEGIGINKSAEEAQELAAAQVRQKAYEKQIDLRRGGGGDAVILTEALCSDYGLDCGRW